MFSTKYRPRPKNKGVTGVPWSFNDGFQADSYLCAQIRLPVFRIKRGLERIDHFRQLNCYFFVDILFTNRKVVMPVL